MINELLIFQTLILITLFFFLTVVNILSLWYLAGIYLVALGFLLYLDDGDIFIGFLWIIDLGVGLIFFIFILHFSAFLYQKAIIELTSKVFIMILFFLSFILLFLIFILNPVDTNFNLTLQKTWFFFISWYDYYDLFFCYTISDLNLMREMYFYNNGFEFLLINFMLFYGIISSICFCFLIKRIFVFMTTTQLLHMNFLTEINVNFFIRNQNFMKQQYASSGTRVWMKQKNNKL